MTCKINADTSDGLKLISDTSGAVEIQSNGVTKVSIDSSGNISTVAGMSTSNGNIAPLRPNVSPIIINGDMMISQRSEQVTGMGGADGVYPTVDRYRHSITNAGGSGRFTSTHEAVNDIAGFTESLNINCTTADTSIAAGEEFHIDQRIEGRNVQGFQKGFSTALGFTVALYVKAQDAKVYAVELKDTDNNRHCTKLFTSTTGWTRHVLNYPADTTGKFADDSNTSLEVKIWLHAGSNFTSGTLPSSWQSVTTANTCAGIGSVYDNTDNFVSITGLQLEVGTFTADTIPDFQFESLGENKTRCQRYFIGDSELFPTTQLTAATAIQFTPQFRTEMRAAPTATAVATGGFGLVGGSYTTTSLAVSNIGVNGGRAAVNIDTSTGEVKQLCQQGLPVTLDAEL